MIQLYKEIDDIEYTLTIGYCGHHCPAKIDGLPEDCHPDESEMEWYVESVMPTSNAKDWTANNDAAIEEACWVAYFEEEPDQ